MLRRAYRISLSPCPCAVGPTHFVSVRYNEINQYSMDWTVLFGAKRELCYARRTRSALRPIDTYNSRTKSILARFNYITCVMQTRTVVHFWLNCACSLFPLDAVSGDVAFTPFLCSLSQRERTRKEIVSNIGFLRSPSTAATSRRRSEVNWARKKKL